MEESEHKSFEKKNHFECNLRGMTEILEYHPYEYCDGGTAAFLSTTATAAWVASNIRSGNEAPILS